ncbi:hypothetical protein [Kitasatospora sp. NPDC093102]|uniref:hypothetical protein n=1 Tax=Kitasatospora sp. NPDC093102 TaxID=3155069 RepID=UPI00341DFC1F
MATLVTGVGLFCNGYGPMALKDRNTPQLSPREAKEHLDDTLRAAVAAIDPPLVYFGSTYDVERDPEHADGEPSLLSNVRTRARVRTRIAPARVPVLVDQMTRLWGAGCRRDDNTVEHQAKHYTDLWCSGSGGALFTLSVVSSTTDPAVDVYLRAKATPVRYQPEKDYGVASVTPPLTGHEPAPDVDDPYWSH